MSRPVTWLIEVLVDLHALLAGAATSLLLFELGADGRTTVLVGLAVATVLQLSAHAASLGKRSDCERGTAGAVRSILDRRLVLTRIDPVGFGDFLTLRHFARAAEAGRLERLVAYGGPAETLAQGLGELSAELEDEVARCYIRLRPLGQAKVDAFAAALKRAGAAAGAMVHAPIDPAGHDAASRRLFGELGDALVAVETAGNALDSAFDARGFNAATRARATSADEQQRREGHAAAVLLRSARDAAQELQLASVQHQIPVVAVSELIGRLARAREHMDNVDAGAFREATDDARHAHRRLRYGDLGDALDAVQRLAASPSDANADAVLRHRLGLFPSHLGELEAVCDGRVRDVRPWSRFEDSGGPTLE